MAEAALSLGVPHTSLTGWPVTNVAAQQTLVGAGAFTSKPSLRIFTAFACILLV